MAKKTKGFLATFETTKGGQSDTFWAIVGILLFPFFVLFWPLYIIGEVVKAFLNRPTAQEDKARELTATLYHRVCAASGPVPTQEEFAHMIFPDGARGVPNPLLEQLLFTIVDLHTTEFEEVPKPPAVCNSLEGARYRDQLSQIAAKGTPKAPDIAAKTIAEAIRELCATIPDLGDGELTVPLVGMLPNVNQTVENIILPFYANEAQPLFKELRQQLDRNLHAASKLPYSPEHYHSSKLVMPTDYDGDDVIYTYLKHTPLLQIFDARIPFAFPEHMRFQHHHVLAGSGFGKTQTLQWFILKDLDRVAKGEASLVVIDSQGDLINRISRLKLFAPGEPLHDKLVLVDPTDIAYPVALSLFSMGTERLDHYSALDRERLQNSIIELLSFVLGSLLGAAMTAKQSTLFNFLIRAMLVIPDATIFTFMDMLQPKGHEKYQEHSAKLSPTARAFFETEYPTKQYDETRQQVLRRLWGIVEKQAFERMFSHAHSKLDLFDEMNQGKVILINTAKDLLKEDGTAVFGSFFLALITQAAQERATLPENQRKPTFVYVDEFDDYAGGGERMVSTILEQARKYKVGITILHQYLAQLEPKMQESLAANCAIKFAGGTSHADSVRMAKDMKCEPSFISEQPKGTFAAFIRGVTQTAVSLSFPFGVMEKQPRMTQEEWESVRDGIRARYAPQGHVEDSVPDEPEREDEEPEGVQDRGQVRGQVEGQEEETSPGTW